MNATHLLSFALLAACASPSLGLQTEPTPSEPTSSLPSAPDPTEPGELAGIDTMCGDRICQDTEDTDLCPWDCVPYEVGERPVPGQEGPACERVTTGFVPLTDIGSGTYLGVAQGGLYPGGANTRPATHTAAGVAIAEAIEPIDGTVCMMSVGMSNTGQKWSTFAGEVAPSIEGLNPDLVLANGAVGSHPVDTTADPDHTVWDRMERQLEADGCSLDTVQIAWVLHAERGPSGDFESAAEVFESDLRATLINLRDRVPHLKLIYLSSRAYAGYGTRNNNPEPYAHQTAFVVKWLIEDQITGSDPELSLDADFPWLSWGPYLWSDGLGPDGVAGGIAGRQEPADGLEYACDDFSTNDGIHPGPGVRSKVGSMLEAFFSQDETATPWFLE
ncbi:MAG: hypothetical protein KTR31_33590 [Myxococcales bacterium]|nr:hypothetical protein [Myxococcales bacterium]